MRANRHILRHEWEDVRADIERVVREESIASVDFRSLSIHDDWRAIEENIYHTFCKLESPTSRPVWLWNALKRNYEGFAPEKPWEYLTQLIDPTEKVWFFTAGNHDKFWFYEGVIAAIVKVIEESYYIDEVNIASKKYEWLVGINHHDVLYATGGEMPERLRKLKVAAA